VVEIISLTTHSATGTDGITLLESAGPPGAGRAAAGVVGAVGSDRCSGRSFWETFSRVRSGLTIFATRFGPMAPPLPMTTAPICQLTGMAAHLIFMALPRATDTVAVLRDRSRSRPM
jgi:hypothetical protein